MPGAPTIGVSRSTAAPIGEPSTASSAIPNIDTVTLDDLSFSPVTSAVPDRLGYLKELGLDYGWGPTSTIQWVLEHAHVWGGLPWWASIATTAVLFRLAMFPLVVRSTDANARSVALTSVTSPIQERMKQRQRAGDVAGTQQALQDYLEVRKRAGISLSKMFVPPIIQGVLGFCGFKLLRAMGTLPVPGFKDGGFLWLTDLTVPDGYLILPGLMAVTLHLMVRWGGDTGGPPTQVSGAMREVLLWVVPGITFIFMGWQPGALCVWFGTTSLMSLIQVNMMKQPTVRRLLGIAPIYTPTTEEGSHQTVMETFGSAIRGVQEDTAVKGTGTKGPKSSSKSMEASAGSTAFMRPTYQAPNITTVQRVASTDTGPRTIDTTLVKPLRSKQPAKAAKQTGIVDRIRDLRSSSTQKFRDAMTSVSAMQESSRQKSLDKYKKAEREKALLEANERNRRR